MRRRREPHYASIQSRQLRQESVNVYEISYISFAVRSNTTIQAAVYPFRLDKPCSASARPPLSIVRSLASDVLKHKASARLPFKTNSTIKQEQAS
jgi:hypothetical protein